MTTRISRRTWWTVTGGSLVAAASAALWWKGQLPGVGPAKAPPASDYVDHDGWMLSARDKERLAGAPPAERP